MKYPIHHEEYSSHFRDPTDNASVSILGEEEDHKRIAELYYETALRHRIGFGDICRLVNCMARMELFGPEMYDDLIALDHRVAKLKRDRGTMDLEAETLSLEDLFAIFARSREHLLLTFKLTNDPKRIKKIKAFIKKHDDIMDGLRRRCR